MFLFHQDIKMKKKIKKLWIAEGSTNSNLFLADSRFSRISGKSPFLTELLTNQSPVGVLMKSSGERLKVYNNFSSFWCKTENSADTCFPGGTPVFVQGAFLQQGGVAQIVSHHDGRIQWREIQCGYWNAVIPAKSRGLVSEMTIRVAWRCARACTHPFSGSMTVAPV